MKQINDLHNTNYSTFEFIFFTLLGQNDIRPFSTEEAVAILYQFLNKHVANGICFHDKTNIPEKDIQTLYKQIISNSTQIKGRMVFLRQLSYDILQSSCSMTKQLNDSFKRLDKMYHLDNEELNKTLQIRSKDSLCCTPDCKCLAIKMKEMIQTFSSAIKIKLETFVAELEYIDDIVTNSLLKTPSSIRNRNRLREKISRRKRLPQTLQHLQDVLLNNFVDDIVGNKGCSNISFKGLVKTSYQLGGSDTKSEKDAFNGKQLNDGNGDMLHNKTNKIILSVENLDNVTVTLFPTTLATTTKKQTRKNRTKTNSSLHISLPQATGYVQTLEYNKHGNELQGSPQSTTNRPLASTKRISTLSTKTTAQPHQRLGVSFNKNNDIQSRTELEFIPNGTTKRPLTSTNTSDVSTPMTTERPSQRPGGSFNRIISRRRTTTSFSSTATMWNAYSFPTTPSSQFSSTSISTTLPSLTTPVEYLSTARPKKNKFNPFLRNVFGRG